MADGQTSIERLLNAREVAGKLQVHPSTVRRMARAGQLPYVIVGERSVRFRAADVDLYVNERVVAPVTLPVRTRRRMRPVTPVEQAYPWLSPQR